MKEIIEFSPTLLVCALSFVLGIYEGARITKQPESNLFQK